MLAIIYRLSNTVRLVGYEQPFDYECTVPNADKDKPYANRLVGLLPIMHLQNLREIQMCFNFNKGKIYEGCLKFCNNSETERNCVRKITEWFLRKYITL